MSEARGRFHHPPADGYPELRVGVRQQLKNGRSHISEVQIHLLKLSARPTRQKESQ